jgi:hypothetical protein
VKNQQKTAIGFARLRAAPKREHEAKKSKRRQNVISVTSKWSAAATGTNPTKKQRLKPFVRRRNGRGKTSIVALGLALPL